MNQKPFRFSDSSLLILFLVCFIFGGVFLSFTSNKALDPDYEKNWWTVSFDRPTDNSAAFTIANHTPTSEFSYLVTSENSTSPETTLSIPTGSSETIIPSEENSPLPFRIIIHHGEETREIYKRSKE